MDDVEPQDHRPGDAPDRPRRPLILAAAPALAGAVLALKLVLAGTAPLTNPDTYFHLRFGSELTGAWRPWSPGHLDRFGTADWVPTQWLAQLGMHGAESWFGLPGVAVLSMLCLTALVVVWYATARRYADPLVSVLLTALCFVVSSGSLSARPQTLSFVLATLTVLAWSRSRDRGGVPWLLVPLVWIWSMLHGMWILGVVISVVAVAALLLERKVPRRALLVPVAAFATAFLTPAGPRLPLAVFEVNSRSAYFPEWAAPSFTSVAGAAVLLFVAAGVLPLARTGGRPYEIAMVALGALFAAYSLRTVPVAACVLLPVVAGRLQALIGERTAPGHGERRYVAALAGLAILATVLIAPHTADRPLPFTAQFDAQLDALPRGTAVLTAASDGGPMMWAHPELDFPLHGYADVYTDRELATYADLFALEPGWDRTLARMGVRDALLPKDASLTYALVQDGWRVTDAVGSREFLVAPGTPRGS